MTLREFVQQVGSQERAAREIGVALLTVGRWLRKERKPSLLAQARLRAMGIEAGGDHGADS